ncbi:DUF6053 domain-containing protein [Lysobacter enzymogenes]
MGGPSGPTLSAQVAVLRRIDERRG